MFHPPPPPPLTDEQIDLMYQNDSRLPYLRLDDVIFTMSSEQCLQEFRCDKFEIRFLTAMISPDIRRQTNRHGALKPQEMLCAFLRTIAYGAKQQVE